MLFNNFDRRNVRGYSVNRSRSIIASSCLAVAFLILPVCPAEAQCYWVKASGDWSDAQNWNGGVPTSSSDAYLANGGTATIAAGQAVCKALNLGGNTGTGAVMLTGGSLNATMPQIGGSGAGYFTHSGGTFTVPSGNSLSIKSNGQYTLSNSGVLKGNYEFIDTQNFLHVGGTNSAQSILVGYDAGSQGNYTLKDTGQLTTTMETLGWWGNGTMTQWGGTHSVTDAMYLGWYNNGNGTYLLNGGSLSATNDEYVGKYGTGTFTQSGGTNTTIWLTLGLYSGSTGTYNLNGGILTLNQLTAGGGTAVFNFGGGTLRRMITAPLTLPVTLTGTGGNANIDTSSNSVTISGQLSGPGGLNKLGTNTLTLSAANTYGGDTDIRGGTLSISNPYLADQAGVHISSSAKLNLGFTGSDTVGSLYLDGSPMALGTWGSSSSHATHIDNIHFSGTGMLNVVPEPSTIALLLTATLGGLLLWRRRA